MHQKIAGKASLENSSLFLVKSSRGGKNNKTLRAVELSPKAIKTSSMSVLFAQKETFTNNLRNVPRRVKIYRIPLTFNQPKLCESIHIWLAELL